MEIEIEKKSLISKSHYENILKKYNTKTVLQINYYFETQDNYFKNNNSALRIRKKNNHYQLTLKIKNGEKNLEYNFDSNSKTLNEMINGQVPQNIFEIINTDLTIQNVATIKTLRSKLSYKNHIIEIDKSTFNHTTDYEIEVESYSSLEAEITLKRFLEDNCIPHTKSKPKIARYFDYN